MGKIFHFDPLVFVKNAPIRCNICTTKVVVRLNNDKIFLVENYVSFLCDFHRNTVDFYEVPCVAKFIMLRSQIFHQIALKFVVKMSEIPISENAAKLEF